MFEFETKKSRFIGFSFKIKTKADFELVYNKIKNEHKKATHICYAYITNDGLTKEEKCFDDGEPKGTAGKPILNVIQKKKLENILVVVVRYFGGTKLGAGGLVRAYSKIASLVIN